MTGIGLAQEKPQRTRPLLRPRQVHQLREEVRRLDDMLAQPQHVLQHVDVPQALRQRTNLSKQLDQLTPRPPAEEERDAIVRREAELREDIRQGMPTAAEMRRNPAGAVDKHRAWERRKKKKILEWKNTRLRMHAGGMLGDLPEDASDVANVETFRPTGGAHELDMYHEQIPGKDFHLPPGPVASTNHAEGEDRRQWLQETCQLLAEFAAKGDAKARGALVRHVGEDEAARMIDAEEAKLGTPAELPAERNTKPRK